MNKQVREDEQILNLKEQLAQIDGEVCYFIGGSLDLTKKYIKEARRELYTPVVDRPRWNAQVEFMDINKHDISKEVYHKIGETSLGVYIYEYVGTIKAQ